MKKYQKIVATGFLIEKEKVLVVQKSKNEDFLPGKFEMPGGKVDFGEQPDEALVREFKEEVSLDIEVITPIHTFAYLSDNEMRHTVEIVYICKMKNDAQEITLGKDHDSHRWISVNDLDELELPQGDEILNAIKIGFKYTKNNQIN